MRRSGLMEKLGFAGKKRMRGRLLALAMAALMAVGSVPTDFMGVHAAGDEGTAAQEDAADVTYDKRFILTEDFTATYSNLKTLSGNSTRTSLAIGGYEYDSESKTGKITDISDESSIDEKYSFVFYGASGTKAGFDSYETAFTGTVDGENLSYSYALNTQATADKIHKASLETTIDATSTVEIIWSSGAKESETNTSKKTRWAVLRKADSNNKTADLVQQDESNNNGDYKSLSVINGNNEITDWNMSSSTSDSSKGLYKTTYTGVIAGTYEIGSSNSAIIIYEVRIKSESSDDDTANGGSGAGGENGENGGNGTEGGSGEQKDTLKKLDIGSLSATNTLTSSIFGKGASVSDEEVYSEDGYIRLSNFNKVKLTTAKGHGIEATSEFAFEAIVPANSVGTMAVGGCTSCKVYGQIYVGGDAIGDKKSLTTDNCGDVVEFAYTNDTNSDITMQVRIVTGSNGAGFDGNTYISSVGYSVAAIPEAPEDTTECDVSVNFADGYAAKLEEATNALKNANITYDSIKYVFKTKESNTEAASLTADDITSASNKVSLAAGTYTLSVETVSGSTTDDAFRAIPYELDSSCKEFTVSSDGNNSITIGVSKITEWKFGSSYDQKYKPNFNKTEGFFKGLYVDAKTNGSKFDASTREKNAQFNNDAYVIIPVDGASEITIEANSGWYVVGELKATISEAKAMADSETNTVGEKSHTIKYTGNQKGFIAIKAVITALKNDKLDSEYITSITVTPIDTATVSGNVAMSDNNDSIPSDLKLLFTSATDAAEVYTADVDSTTGAFSVVLPTGSSSTTYTMSFNQTGYEISGEDKTVTATKGSDITGKSVTCVHNVTHKVTVTLGSEVSDTSGITYTFTQNGTSYTFSDTQRQNGEIQLKDGTYTVSLGGTFANSAYEMDGGTSLTVSGDDVEHAITFKRVSKWLFGYKTGFNTTYQGNSGKATYKGLEIDATASGAKLDASEKDGLEERAQFNANTKISVPVDGECAITVVTYGGLVTVGGENANGNTTFKYNYLGGAGMVDIVSTGKEYIISIEVTPISTMITLSGNVSVASGTLPSDLKLTFTAEGTSASTTAGSDGSYSLRIESSTTDVTYTVKLSNDSYRIVGSSTVAVKDTDVTFNITIANKVYRKVTVRFGSGPDFSSLDDVTFRFKQTDGSEDKSYSYNDVKNGNVELYDGTYRVTIEGDAYHSLAKPYKITSSMELVVNGDTTYDMTFEEATSWRFNGCESDTDDYFASAIEVKTGSSGKGYYNGLEIDATASGAKLSARTDSDKKDTQANPGTIIQVPVQGDCTVTVADKSTDYSPMIQIGGSSGATGTKSSTSVSYAYTGGAGYVEVKIIANTVDTTKTSAYITSISVVYKGDDAVTVEQTQKPYVPETEALKGNVADSISVGAVGQKLKLNQSGGNFSNASGIAYYVFPKTSEEMVLEYDVLIDSATGTSSDTGFFGGVFTENSQYSIAMRKGSTSIKGVYTKSEDEFSGASGSEYTIALNTKVHYKITVSGGKATVTTTFTDTDGVSRTCELSRSVTEDGFYYGMAVADVSAVVTNMTYTKADGTGVYNQNSAYEPKGKAPEPTDGTVKAETTSGTDVASVIRVSWQGDIAEDDGYYMVEVKIDDGDWTTVAEDITGYSYDYPVEAFSKHAYTFRVTGVLGKSPTGGKKSNTQAVSAKTGIITGALAAPVVTATAGTKSITLTWEKDANAGYYDVYRYSYDEGESKKTLIKHVTVNTFEDTSVVQEMPYYYTVIASTSDSNNKSSESEAVWAVATAGHSGEYVYEDEATEINITSRSYDTVLTNQATISGNVYGDGTLAVIVNGTTQDSKAMAYGDAFTFTVKLNGGRNDVNLIFTDANGNKTRQTYNYVYLTNYQRLVDANYSGTDGESNKDNIPEYKTVQAAVNAASEGDIIFVAAGDYEERLVVDKADISIIGQDRENTLIHYYPGKLGTDYEAGKDMSKRCATYIMSGATGFSAENISFKNDYVYATADGKSNKSADALRCDADGAVFVNCKMSSVQDTLYMHSGNQFYYKCRIEGLVDFIYSGDAARALFDDCEIVFVYQSTKKAGYVCAPKTAKSADYGLTFYNCVVTGEEGCNGSDYLLARPWGEDAYVTWINCYMGSVVNKTLPYADMTGSYMNARFYEYGTYGPGFAINADRRQISSSKAAAMTSTLLGWAPYMVTQTLGASYVGSVTTTAVKDGSVTGEAYVDDKYRQTDGDDTGLARYAEEGYASVYGVTGGGLLKETSDNYYKVSSAVEFLDALVKIQESGKKSVIEIAADLNLGYYEVTKALKDAGKDISSYSSIIKAYSAQALTHPTLMETGVSIVTISGMYNLTIFSSNASSIKHANILFKNSGNIIVRNIKFDELWEWDEGDANNVAGDYDRNDWDYMTIDSGADGIWVDHCTFYKAYDGVIDVKNPDPLERVTISWCQFLPGSENDTFFNVMMDTLKANPTKYTYYNSLLNSGMTHEQIWWYAYGQKKTHLFGQSDTSTNASGIRVTLANNYYKDSMDRMPRLRYGKSHVYNCVMDAQDLLDAKNTITNADAAKHIVSNGASSTCGAEVLLENCFMNGITNALNSGNGSSPRGYINAVNSIYKIGGQLTTLAPKVNTEGATDTTPLVTNAATFTAALGYSYYLRSADSLTSNVVAYAGAGALTLTNLQWEKTVYNDANAADGTYVAAGTSSVSGSGSGSNGGSANDGSTNGGYVSGGTDGGSFDSGNDYDSSDSDYDGSSDDTSSSGSSSGSSGTSGTTGAANGSTNPTTTPVSDVLTADDITGASEVKIDDISFAQMGAVSEGTAQIIADVGTDGTVPQGTKVAENASELNDMVLEAITDNNTDNIVIYASQDASVPSNIINSLRQTGKTLSIGVVGDDGKVDKVLTLDGKELTQASEDFTLKIDVGVESASATRAAVNYGISMDKYTVVNFAYSGSLPGVFKVAVNVSDKFADGTTLALYYNNETAGRLENQYQVTTVTNGFAEFAIDHCSQYVLVDISAVRSAVTSSVLTAPKTGDSNHIIFWLVMMGTALAAWFGVQAAREDEKRRQKL